MSSGQVQSSESDISSLEDKDINGSKDEDSSQDKLEDNDSDSESSSESEPGNDKNDSARSSESETDPGEANENESYKEPEKEDTLLYRVQSEFNIHQHCKHCVIQQEQKEQVTPRKVSRGGYWLRLDAEGIYQCAVTGLIFEVTKAATIEYSLLSWTKYAAYVKDPWIVVGPIFDVKCTTPSTLTSIQFPHALCLSDHLSDVTFNVFHFKKGSPEFESSVDHSTTHVKWHVSSLSPVGPVIEKRDPVNFHAVVMLYKVINDHPSLKFRVYIASNNSSFIKDVTKTVKRSPNRFVKIEKPPYNKLLQTGRKYRLTSDPEADINPEEMEFVDDSTLAEKHFFEVYLEQPVEFTLSLLDLESQDVVWKAKLRECDWIQNNQNNNNLKRSKSTQRRKSSFELSEDELCHKRFKGNDASDGSKSKVVLTDQQLMAVARKMGKEWKALGIEYLNLTLKDIEQIEAKEDDVNMCKCLMLRKWRDSEKNNGTAQSLYDCLNKEDSSYDMLESLKGYF